MDLMSMAMERMQDDTAPAAVEALTKLVELQERVEDRQATRAFFDAFAQFQAKCPQVERSQRAEFKSKGGGNVRYDFAPLEEVDRTVKPVLSPLGFSYSWDCETVEGHVEAACKLRHAHGHCETARFRAPIEGTQLMSGPQKTAAALSFAKRQSLLQVLGIATAEADNDAPRVDQMSTVTEEQVANLRALADEIPTYDESKFLAWLGVESIEDLPASRYRAAVKSLEVRRAQG